VVVPVLEPEPPLPPQPIMVASVTNGKARR
jgi:hypothetical protein